MVIGLFHEGTIPRIEKDAIIANQLQPIPRRRIVTGRQDQRTLSLGFQDHQFGHRCGAQAQIDHMATGGP
ncbi:MAG: hypothetical protein CME13_12840 [Gemmatimonadetes bacterium]|nr:hypothetical protein [Gemmatimonadota bacterium]